MPSYLQQYGSKGAHVIKTDVVDLLNLLWAPTAVLDDSAKAAAIAAYIPYWAKGQVWTYENPDAWNEEFYVKTQNVTLAQAQGDHQARQQAVCSRRVGTRRSSGSRRPPICSAEGGFVKKFDVDTLFDRRFESIAAKAVPAEYRR